MYDPNEDISEFEVTYIDLHDKELVTTVFAQCKFAVLAQVRGPRVKKVISIIPACQKE